jgi:tetratricopeptide (TPR) repeat protein
MNQLILQAADPGLDRALTFINPELNEQETAINFIGGWSLGDYGLAYDLLSRQSAVREDLERDEWIERHRTWAKEAKPARVELGFVHEREASQSALWLPTPTFGSRASTRKEIEVGWSLELIDTPLAGTLPEMPMGTSVNKETGRHWFWTIYTLVREHDAWRIQSVSDEGRNVQGFSIDELQKRISEYDEIIDTKLKQRGPNVQEMAQELSWRLTAQLHYYDALLSRLPLDRKIYEDAFSHTLASGNAERAMVYIERILQRFPENRGEMLRRLGAIQTNLAYMYAEQGLTERQKRFLASAEETLRESLSIDDNVMGRLLLGEFLLSEERNDESEEQLLQASTLSPTPEQEASIEAGLGNLAMRRERINDAIPHYQRVAELAPSYPGVWFNLGFAYRLQGQLDDAEASYRRAVQLEPGDIRVYSELIAIYMNRDEKQRAREIAELGVRANPDVAQLHALLASVLFEMGEARGAQRELQEAERLDPEQEIVKSVRQYIHSAKKK